MSPTGYDVACVGWEGVVNTSPNKTKSSEGEGTVGEEGESGREGERGRGAGRRVCRRMTRRDLARRPGVEQWSCHVLRGGKCTCDEGAGCRLNDSAGNHWPGGELAGWRESAQV